MQVICAQSGTNKVILLLFDAARNHHLTTSNRSVQPICICPTPKQLENTPKSLMTLLFSKPQSEIRVRIRTTTV
ncbi:hypothetical protein HZ326_20118 [Fusarium oxysporum f. sp. albedinis]|nr:hypothetical protein HZ326_20118 [Fusarium oxysporum f. sp. albedinis]